MNLEHFELYIDDLINDFPGNRKFQAMLGLDITNGPYESILDTYTEPNIVSFINTILAQKPLNFMPPGAEKEIKRLVDDYLAIMNRIAMIRLLTSPRSKYQRSEDINPQKIDEYINIIAPLYTEAILNTMRALVKIITDEIETQYRLQNMFSN